MRINLIEGDVLLDGVLFFPSFISRNNNTTRDECVSRKIIIITELING